MIPVELSRIIINERSDEQVIYLREVDGPREFPIVIGLFESFAIDRIVKGNTAERPLTHDLLLGVLHQLDGELRHVVIDDLEDEVYYAKLVLERGKEQRRVDARPSDAVTLALKAEVPVYVAEKVMNAACAP